MKFFGKYLIPAVFGIALTSSAALAGTLGQKAALATLQSGTLSFDAGSVGNFEDGGTNGGSFLFNHGSSREKAHTRLPRMES